MKEGKGVTESWRCAKPPLGLVPNLMQSRAKTPLKVCDWCLSEEWESMLSTEPPAGGIQACIWAALGTGRSQVRSESYPTLIPLVLGTPGERRRETKQAGIADSLKLRYTFIPASTTKTTVC